MAIPKETNICISELKEEDSFPVSVFPKLIKEIINETKATRISLLNGLSPSIRIIKGESACMWTN
ncbi:hypothetical protein [Bacteroides nordii]|uniref:hypothetical protein n=1 Tax=Bacteroides nordii TaxID=291645 RepID=UPI001E366F64|nr:hypothetical protein [Bacteroides nordii]